MRSNKILFIVLVLFVSLVSFQGCKTPQKLENFPKVTDEIVPGVGIGELKLGLSYREVKEILGEPVKILTCYESGIEYIQSGHDPTELLIFALNFDYEMTYKSPTSKSSYPVYMLYFRQDRLCYIVLSSYTHRGSLHPFLIKGKLGFNCNKAQMEQVLGKNYHIRRRKPYSDEFRYLDKGVSVILDEDLIKVMSIYKPLDRKMKEAFLRKSKESSPKAPNFDFLPEKLLQI